MHKRFMILALGVALLASMAGCATDPVPVELAYINGEGALILVTLDLGRMAVSSTRTVHGEGVTSAVWSPEGKQLAFVTGEAPNALLSIGVINQAATDPANACPVGLDSIGRGDVSWAPTGEWLGVSVGTGWIHTMEVYRPGECRPVAMLSSAGSAWSPAGNQVIYARPRAVEPAMPWDSGESTDLVLHDLTLGGDREIVLGSSQAMFVPEAWPTLERVLAWRTSRDGARTLLSLDPKTGEVSLAPATLPPTRDRSAVEQLLPDELRAAFKGGYTWDPDGRAVAATLQGEGAEGPEVWVFAGDDQGEARSIRIGSGHAPVCRSGE